MSKKTKNQTATPTTTPPKPRRAYKRRKPAVPPELSAKRRAASLTQWEGKERTPYKTIRLSARAVDMIRADAARRGISASQAVTCAIENSENTDYQCEKTDTPKALTPNKPLLVCEVCGEQATCYVRDVDRDFTGSTVVSKPHGSPHLFCTKHNREPIFYCE